MTTTGMANGAARPTLVVPNGGLGAGRGKHRSGRSGGLFRGRQRRRTVVPAAALEQWDPEQVRVCPTPRWRAAPNYHVSFSIRQTR